MNTSLVLENDQAAVNGIRASGAKNLILAPGDAWSGGHSWLDDYGAGATGDYLYKLADPLNNTAFDIHEYLDFDFSGSHSICNQSASANLAGVTSWLKKYGFKAMITEFGSGNNTQVSDHSQRLICQAFAIAFRRINPFSPLSNHFITAQLTLSLSRVVLRLHSRRDQLYGRERRLHRMDGMGRRAILGQFISVLFRQ